MATRVVGPRFPVRAFVPLLMVLFVSSAGTVTAAPVLYLSGGGIGQLSGLWIADPSTGNAIYVAPILPSGGGTCGASAGGLAYDPVLDRLFATGTDTNGQQGLYRVNRQTGAATFVGHLGADIPGSGTGLTFDPVSRRLYATSGTPFLGQHSGLFELDPDTGAATLIGATQGTGAYLYGLGFDPVGNTLYANGTSDFLASGSKLFSVNAATGDESAIGGHGVAVGRQIFYSGLAFHPDTQVAYAMGSVTASTSGLYSVDLATGAATLVGTFATSFGVDGGAVFVDAPAVDATPRFGSDSPGMSAWPNPSRGIVTARFSLERPTGVVLSVYDIGGRRVATLDAAPLGAGPHEVTWTGRDSSGRRTPAGVYLLALDSTEGRLATTRIVRLR